MRAFIATCVIAAMFSACRTVPESQLPLLPADIKPERSSLSVSGSVKSDGHFKSRPETLLLSIAVIRAGGFYGFTCPDNVHVYENSKQVRVNLRQIVENDLSDYPLPDGALVYAPRSEWRCGQQEAFNETLKDYVFRHHGLTPEDLVEQMPEIPFSIEKWRDTR